MGVIQRQGIKGTIALYIGMLLGYFNTLWLFPYCLSAEQIGVVRTLFDASSLFLTISSLGTIQITLRYFPYFKNEKEGHYGFFGLLLFLILIGSTLFTILFFVFESPIRAYFGEKSPLFLQYIYYTIPFTVVLAIFNALFYYSSSLYRIVIPNFIQNVYMRIGLSLIVVAYFWNWISFEVIAQGYIWLHVGGVILLIIYLQSIQQLFIKSWNFVGKISKKSIMEILFYGCFSIFTNAGIMLVFQIDTLMISGTIGLKQAGVYFIVMSMANMIDVPGRALVQISVPILSQAMKDENESQMLNLYVKTSITQLVVGGFLFLLLAINAENFFSLIPKAVEYKEGIVAFYFVGLARLVYISDGIGGSFITYAKYYKFNMILMIVMLLLTIGLNDLLIDYGLQGIAFGTFLTLLMLTIFKIWFVKSRYGFFPYTQKSFYFILLLAGFWGMNAIIPSLQNVYLDILLSSFFTSILFLPIIYYLKLSLDLNQLIDSFLEKVKK